MDPKFSIYLREKLKEIPEDTIYIISSETKEMIKYENFEDAFKYVCDNKNWYIISKSDKSIG
jgi:hypothetical protein